MSTTITVFGLSDVGKSFLFNKFTAGHSEYVHVQSSALLRAAKERETGQATESEALRHGEVLDNQALLLVRALTSSQFP